MNLELTIDQQLRLFEAEKEVANYRIRAAEAKARAAEVRLAEAKARAAERYFWPSR